jgi:hypothetical protein
MNTRQESSKLVELRSKTDRQLMELITRTLEAALCFARSEDFRGQAERASDEVRRLLPALAQADRRRVEARLAKIEDRLRPRAAHAACF